MTKATVTCRECDCIIDITFAEGEATILRECPYCGTELHHAEVIAANLVLARSETRAVAAAFVHALRAFAKTIEGQVPLAPAYAEGVLEHVRNTFVDGPLKDAMR